MINKISRFFILFIIVLVTAVYLPQYYWISFEKRIATPMGYFSPILQQFLISKFDYQQKNYNYVSPDGKKYTRQQADYLLPLMNYRILTSKGQMPDSIRGQKIDLNDVRINNIFIRIRPEENNTPVIPLFPLFESNPPRLKLTVPDDFFRITERIEFINTSTNRINEIKSEIFTKSLKEQGFVFPATKIFGNPTTRKSFDEGYFIVDSQNQLFHLKMINGKPFCRNTHKPDSIHIRSIFVKEHDLKEFYATVVDQKNNIYFLMYDGYRLQKLPVYDYNPDNDNLFIYCNLFYRVVNIKKDNRLLTFALDRKYHLIGIHQESWPTFYESTAGKLSKFLFPFTLQIHKNTTDYINFYFDDFSINAIFFHMFLVLLIAFIFRYREQDLKKSWFDFIWVLFTGIYGFIGVLLFEPPVD